MFRFLLRIGLPATVLAIIMAGPGASQGEPSAGRAIGVAGEEYDAGWLHRWLFGSSYRELWTLPIEVDVLDVEALAGGLTATGTGGGKQTLALRFSGADGRPYTFRTLNKDPGETLPEDLRGTAIHDLYQDQISAALPTGHLVVPPMLEALGLLHSKPRLVILPDSPALGEWRADFAGQMGMIEEWPNEGPDGSPGFAGATEIISTVELLDRLQTEPDRPPLVEEYLTGRLLDVMIGDWDRHEGQWRWANVGPGNPPAWRPIPEDRDQAFAGYDGFMLSLAREYAPQLTNYGPGFASPLGPTWNGRDVDRALLANVEWEVWQSRARFVQDRLTDSVLEAAVERLPVEYQALVGEDLLAALRARRDGLPSFARSYYEHTATEVEIRGSSTGDRIQVQRTDGAAEVTVSSGAGQEPRFRRVFRKQETNEVRIHLGAGDDEVVVSGDASSGIQLRVVADEGRDSVVNQSSESRVRVYDSRPQGTVVEGRVGVDRRAYTPPAVAEEEVPPRDWGGRLFRRFLVGGNSDLGPVIGGGVVHEKYGFRKLPYGREIRVGGAWAFGKKSGRADFRYRRYRENSKTHFSLTTFVSGIEILRFYGLGNETPRGVEDDFYEVFQTQLMIEPSMGATVAPHTELEFAAAVLYAVTEDDTSGFVGQTMPYGSEDFGSVRVRGNLVFDTRNTSLAASRGVYAMIGASVTPEVWDVSQGTFGSVSTRVEGYLTPWRRTTLALAAGARSVFGPYPFHEAAYLGGFETARGYSENRFAGDTAVFGRATLRLSLGRFFLLLPNEFGIAIFADTGRVFLEGEDSQRWHPGFGGGFWLAPRDRENAALLGLAVGDEDTRVYLSLGGF